MSTPAKIKLFIVLTILIAFGGISLFIYNLWTSYPNDFPRKEYTLVADRSTTITTFAEKLEEDGIINNREVFLLKSKLQKDFTLQQGEYTINIPASSDDIINQIYNSSIKKSEEIRQLANLPTVTVTFKEGFTLDEMFDILEKNEVAKKEDLEIFASNPANANKFNYSFLPERLTCNYGDLKTCAKYYFEGYLYPDTYSFFKNSKIEDVFAKMLGNFDTKVWQKLSPKPDPSDFYKTLTLASVIEKESGRTKGVTAQNREELQSERRDIAAALINRTNQGIRWQSDVTASYGTDYVICQQTFEVKNCKYLDDPIVNTKYNTYIIKGYPIGPLSNPDFDNITAALNPSKNDFIFFVADVTGKVYFSSNEAGHIQNIEKVKQINRNLGL